jgi:chorismate-pyruvate lyase
LSEVTPAPPQLDELIELFHSDATELGVFEACNTEQCPSVYRQLLAHNAHMTVTVERRHGELVDVEVLRDTIVDEHYLREILLRKKSNSAVVQYGIVRLKLATISLEVRQEILAKQIPLGRVLIQHNVMRQVQLSALWRVTCGPILAKFFGVDQSTVTYGRTAMIFLDDEPAIELLEIVSPESNSLI